jgi:hypothetical protein
MKELALLVNNSGGYDLTVERDADNVVRILTGKKERSLEFFKQLKELSEVAINDLETN